MNKLTHSQPAQTRPVVVQINIDVSLLFWPLYALLWLGWLTVRGVGRFIRKFLYEYPRAVIVVSGRRLRRAVLNPLKGWLRGSERRCAWMISGLLWGPVMGVG